jgi:ABC-type sugar transport system ATPase subunit
MWRRPRRSPPWELRGVALTVASDEIVGVAGLNREGRRELLLSLLAWHYRIMVAFN